jgi:hypothetical protein
MIATMKLCIATPADIHAPEHHVYTIEVTGTTHAPEPPPNAVTHEVCVLPSPTPPVDLTDIWEHNGVPTINTRAIANSKFVPLNPNGPQYECSCG